MKIYSGYKKSTHLFEKCRCKICDVKKRNEDKSCQTIFHLYSDIATNKIRVKNKNILRGKRFKKN